MKLSLAVSVLALSAAGKSVTAKVVTSADCGAGVLTGDNEMSEDIKCSSYHEWTYDGYPYACYGSALCLAKGATLNCQGHAISFEGYVQYGVVLQSNSTLKGCTIHGFENGFGFGRRTEAGVEIVLRAKNVEISDVAVTNNDHGIHVSHAKNVEISDVAVTNNYYGIRAESYSSVTLTRVQANGNLGGIYSDYGSDITLREVVANDNGNTDWYMSTQHVGLFLDGTAFVDGVVEACGNGYSDLSLGFSFALAPGSVNTMTCDTKFGPGDDAGGYYGDAGLINCTDCVY